jgi:hypothetical protein
MYAFNFIINQIKKILKFVNYNIFINKIKNDMSTLKVRNVLVLVN